MSLRETIKAGECAVLAEEGGYAVIKVIGRDDGPDWVGIRIRFEKILRQYPFVEYFPEDEIDIGYNPKYVAEACGWDFESVNDYWIRRIKAACFELVRRGVRHPHVIVVGETVRGVLEEMWWEQRKPETKNPIGPIGAWRFMGKSIRFDISEPAFRLEEEK